MDIIGILVLCFMVFVILTVCMSCCQNYKEGTQGTVYGVAQPDGMPPYPVDNTGGMPQPMAAPPGFNTNVTGTSAPYPSSSFPVAQVYYPPTQGTSGVTPYPPATGYSVPMPMPMPMGGGGFSGGAPYPTTQPPYPTAQATEQQPPSYAEAVNQPHGQAPSQPHMQEVYAKQSPYNPNF